MAIGDVYSVKIHFTLQGNRNIRQLFYRIFSNTSGNPDDESIATYFDGAAGLVLIAANQTVNLLYDCIEVQRLFDQAANGGDGKVVADDIYYLNINEPGIISINKALPGQCSLLIQSRVIQTPMNPKYQGRDFWTGWNEGDQDNGEWVLARWDIIGDAILGVISVVASGGNFVANSHNWSPTYAKAFNAAPAVNAVPWAQIQEYRGVRQVRTQRRRQALNPCDRFFGDPIP